MYLEHLKHGPTKIHKNIYTSLMLFIYTTIHYYYSVKNIFYFNIVHVFQLICVMENMNLKKIQFFGIFYALNHPEKCIMLPPKKL